ncbi:hypothetical protein FIE12Z_11891 [Fusarium flagelliforme]|uniref:Uncharacterized protein n=1 Tax=Fusarium flagelliforme TaxID=2675880 RepID=A0A395M7P2_9HYPO|nr:hypothetical protein FIE12Z_11891 [Fusarium flagelliforme]
MEPWAGATAPSASISEALPVQIELLNPPDISGGILNPAGKAAAAESHQPAHVAEKLRRQHIADPISRCRDAGPPRQIALADRATNLTVTKGAMIPALGYLFLSTADRRANAWLFTWSAYNDYNSGVPQPRYLPTPTHLNALDAMARNTAVIGFHQRALPRRPHLTLQHAQAQPPVS